MLLSIKIESQQMRLLQYSLADANRMHALITKSKDHPNPVFAKDIGAKYATLEAVETSFRHPPDPWKLRMGIWVRDVYVGGINLRPYGCTAEVGYWLGKDYLGRGYATNAVRALCNYAFKALRLASVLAKVEPDNKGSVKVLERASFVLAGCHKDQLFFQLLPCHR